MSWIEDRSAQIHIDAPIKEVEPMIGAEERVQLAMARQ
jgi:hypothetical protein